MKRHFTNAYLMPFKPFAAALTFVSVRQSMIRRVRTYIDSGEGHFEHILSSDMINNKNSTVIKSIIYIKLLYRLVVKYFVVKVFIV